VLRVNEKGEVKVRGGRAEDVAQYALFDSTAGALRKVPGLSLAVPCV
jgi:hypothetical protein